MALLAAVYVAFRLLGRIRSFGRPSLEAAGILLLGVATTWTRLRTLTWDLQHGAEGYELLFVSPALDMIRSGDLNHRFHLYPGLFIYLLAAVFVVAFVVAVSVRPGATFEAIPFTAYLGAARGFVACCSMANVSLTYALARAHGAGRLSVVAAGFVCFSLAEVENSQLVRPDVVLATALTLSLVLMARLVDRGTVTAAALAGLCVGAATAVKYTGFLAIPALLVACVLPRRGWERGAARVVVACAALLAAYLLLSPYSLLDLPGFVGGLAQQRMQVELGAQSVANLARANTLVVGARMLGYLGLGAALVGVTLALRAPRRQDWVLLCFLATYLGFLANAPLQGDRLLLPVGPVLGLFAARGLSALWMLFPGNTRLRWCAIAASLAIAFAGPGYASWSYVVSRTAPSPRERLRFFVDSHLPAGSQIAVSRLGPSLDEARFAVGRFVVFDAATFHALRHYDYAVSSVVDSTTVLSALQRAVEFSPPPAGSGRTQTLWRVPPDLRPRYSPVACSLLRASSTTGPENLKYLFDGDPDTVWRLASSEGPADLRICLPRPMPLGKLVLRVRAGSERHVQRIAYSTGETVPLTPLEAHLRMEEPGRYDVFLPDVTAECVQLELPSLPNKRVGLREIEVHVREVSR
ncbi:MAG TPA: glycosyltransferase family 39 protein [Vicinamibacteria bacterium]|nr:glycosyltransferase family 39 protein [Vicinamibacteria bacterium]